MPYVTHRTGRTRSRCKHCTATRCAPLPMEVFNCARSHLAVPDEHPASSRILPRDLCLHGAASPRRLSAILRWRSGTRYQHEQIECGTRTVDARGRQPADLRRTRRGKEASAFQDAVLAGPAQRVQYCTAGRTGPDADRRFTGGAICKAGGRFVGVAAVDKPSIGCLNTISRCRPSVSIFRQLETSSAALWRAAARSRSSRFRSAAASNLRPSCGLLSGHSFVFDGILPPKLSERYTSHANGETNDPIPHAASVRAEYGARA